MTNNNDEQLNDFRSSLKFSMNRQLLESILRITKTHIENEKQFLDLAIEEAVKITGSQVGYFHFINKDENSIALKTWSDFTLTQCTAAYDSHYPLNQAGIWADCVRNRAPVIHNDYPNTPNRKGLPEGHFVLKRHMSVPLFFDGKIIAIAGVGNKTEAYTEDDTSLLQLFMKDVIEIYARYKNDIELADYQKNLRLALTKANAGVFRWDVEEDKIKLGEKLRQLFLLPENQEVITWAEWQILVFRESAPEAAASLLQQWEKQNDFIIPFVCAVTEGLKRYFEMHGQISRNAKGEPVKITGIVFDITQRKVEEIEREKLLVQVQQANKDLQLFAYAVSHDLQAPLRKVKNFAQLLGEKLDKNTESKIIKYINYIISGVSQMHEMIQGVLDFSRISTHGSSFSHCETANIVTQVISNLQPVIQEKKADITVDLLPVIYADKIQIGRVFQNIIENALKYSAPGRKPSVHIYCEEKDKHFIFSVKDNGIGMREEDFNRIFQIFQRLHTESEYQGSGIGLALCKRIIERHRGEIWVHSDTKKSEGSIFSFSIPKFIDIDYPDEMRSK